MDLSTFEVKKLLYTWYKSIDNHVSVSELIPMLYAGDLEMHYPEGIVKTQEGFISWYNNYVNQFFDGEHNVKMMDIEIKGETAITKLLLNWQTLIWNPPEARSKWIGCDIYETFGLIRDKRSSNAVINLFIVDKVELMEGSASFTVKL